MKASPYRDNAPGLSGPPDESPNVFSDPNRAEEILAANDPDFLVGIATRLASRGWSEQAGQDALRDLYRHVQPIFEKAQQEIDDFQRTKRRSRSEHD
jgi:hypothetical protein